MRNSFPLFCIVAFLLGLTGAAAQPPGGTLGLMANPAFETFGYAVPRSWRLESYSFPLPWSPKIAYSGIEDVLFVPDFADRGGTGGERLSRRGGDVQPAGGADHLAGRCRSAAVRRRGPYGDPVQARDAAARGADLDLHAVTRSFRCRRE